MFAISEQIVDLLKQGLRSEGITYAQLAKGLSLSEASVKRMFSKRDFSLKRLDAICTACKLDLSTLLQQCRPEAHLKDHLGLKQERALVQDKTLLMIALCAMNHMTFDQIIATYTVTAADCLRCLTKLDRMGFLDLYPHNRIRLLVSRTFRWIPGGPIENYFRDHVADYFATPFQQQGEFLSLTNVMLSDASRTLLSIRMKALVDEFVQAHARDTAIGFENRHATSILLAARPWELPFMRDLRR